MTMASNAYKIQIGTSDRTVAELLIAGFSGQLKGWWDYYLTKIQQLNILNVVQVSDEGGPVPNELGNPIQDAVSTLIFAIPLHFIGDSTHLKDKNADLLSNLRCKKLSDFQWYKSTFLSRVVLREDSNQPFWKEKFLAGLPTLLGEKVRNKIRETFGSHIIPYDQLTYGQLISLTQKQGLEICQDLKLQKHLKWELRKSKKELGSFCNRETKSVSKRFRDFRPRSKDKNHDTHHKKHYYKKPYRKSFRKQYDKPKTNKANLKDITCYKCGKKGHISKYCRVSRKIQELHLEGEVLDRIEALLAYSSDSETEMSSEGQNPQLDELVTTSSSSSDSNSDDDYESKHVNVLIKEQNLILDVIQHISNPQKQKKCLDQLKKSLEEEPKTVETNIPSTSTGLYDLFKTYKRK
ncbi:uncharacterized protein LOC126672420 [Mercurialis annua]|uniref:uncharacterized protein LOC126672420 n=1 Tax=Mercurialis annua TaxID=3986 RepID=UPI00215FDB89|nr:uncharacterized protein LOC126672420 [Mercurialis annua]